MDEKIVTPKIPSVVRRFQRHDEWVSTLSPEIQSILESLNARFPYSALFDENDTMIDEGFDAFADFSDALPDYDVDLYDGVFNTWGASQVLQVVALRSNGVFVMPCRCTVWHHWRLDPNFADQLRAQDK